MNSRISGDKIGVIQRWIRWGGEGERVGQRGS